MKKRLLALFVLALVMVLSLASCGDPIGDWLDKINPKEEYAVYFVAGEGVGVPAQTVKDGELVTKPEDPTKKGFDFDGWYKDEELTTPWNFETDVIEGNTIIYAKWNEHIHEGGEATCTSGPICEKCGDEYGEALGHKGGTATCTSKAVCEVCGEEYGDVKAHVGDEATCTTGAVCNACGITYTDPLGHTGGEANCTTGATCERCGKVYTDALGHTVVVDEAVAPTCTETGLTEGSHCSVCNEVLTAQTEVAALGHAFGEWIIDAEATEDIDGLKHRVCGACGETEEVVIPALKHEHSYEAVVTDPTCTEGGYTTHTCRCGDSYVDSHTEALDHIDENVDYVCDRCNEALENPIKTTTIKLELTKDDVTPVNGPQNVRVGEFDIILSSEKSRIESSPKTFKLPDGSEVKKSFRINFNGSETIYDPETGTWQNAIMFMASGKGTVTIYWYHAGKGSDGDTSSKAYRNVALWDAEGNILAQSNGQYTYEELIVTTFEFDAAGTYYIGNLAGANNFYYVEVSYEGELVELPDLAKYPVHFNTGDGSAIDSVEVEEGGLVEKPEDPTREGFDFAGWYKDEACTEAWNFSSDRITSETVLYAKWEETYTGEYEDVHYELNISNLETGKRTEDEINGMFTIVADTEVRNRTRTWTDPENDENTIEFTKSVKIGGNANMIKISVPGDGKLTFFIQNGSSGVDTQFTKVIAPDGTIYDIEFPAGSQSNPVVKIELDVTEGEWTIARGKNSGTQDIFFIALDCSVEISPETGFELVDDGKIEYILGEDLDTSKLVLNATFANGKTEPLTLADVTIDSSAFNKDVEGTYTITISYKEYAPISYVVSVFAPVSVELDFDAIEKLANNSAAGNGVYYNHSFRELYFLGEELDLSGLSVTVVAKCGEATKSFRVTDYEITGFDASEGGEKELTVSYGGVSATVKVYVSYTEPTADEFGVYNALVDPAYLGPIGDLSGPYHVFNTIQQALDFLAKADPTAQKVITIAPGQYNEKLEITIPNLKIVGVGESSEDVVIEWDSLYGLFDAGGFSHTTDSTATVAIRDTATNVSIENVTISNYWNSQERMDEAGLAIERGLALLVQSDRFVMKNSRLLGIQDTLELFTGRQYFENVYISGYTDFIFGTNNTTYFKNCQIHVIDTVKDDGGTAGYITAFKGSNKGANDSIVYGAIFDGCKFTADEGVMEGKTAIGRPWGAYAAVAVINSELGGHISLAGYSTSKNERYVSMNAKPTDATVQFVEYNNTGAGALTEAVAGMRMLTAEEAALYVDFATIFGKVNGNVSYLDPWDPTSTEVVVDDREYYYFNGQEGTSGTSYTYTDNIQGTTGTLGNLVIDATVGKLTARGSDSQFNAGAKIIFNVEAGTLVTVISYPGYGYYTINGIAHNAHDTFSVYFAEACEVVIEATATSYLYQIIINPNEEAPEAPTLTEVKVEGMVTDYLVGEEISLEGVTVNAHYSDFSVRPVEYTVDTSAVNNAVAGEYAVVFTVGNETITVTVKFVSDFAISESTTIDLSATGANIQGTVGTYQGLTIDATNGKFADNQGGWTQVNTGTVITFNVVGEAEVSVTAYSSADNFDIIIVDGLCTITATANNYLKAISVKIKVVYGEDTTIDLSATGANIQKTVGVYEGLTIDATNGKFADNNGGWTQVNTGTIITLNVLEGAEVSVTAYSSADNFTVVVENGVCTITAVGNDYLKAITVTYPAPEVTHTFDAGVLADVAKESKADGETELVGDFFTIHYGKNSVVEGSEKKFADGFVSTKRFTLGGKATPGTDGKCCVEFTVSGKSTVKIWWISGGDGRQMTIFGADGSALQKTEVSVKNALYITEFTVEAGTYFIGGDTGSNYICQIVVSPASEVEEPAHECESICEECGLCLDAECLEDACAEKCQGHEVIFSSNTTIDLSAIGTKIEGATGKYNGLEIDATAGKFADNGSGWVQVNTGTIITLNVLEGAVVSVNSYSANADNFTIVVADGVCTITVVGNDYINAITIAYPVVYGENTTIDLTDTDANIQGGTGVYEGLEVDATNGKFADNGSGWVQVNTGTIITLNVLEGAVVSVNSYSANADNFTIVVADGVCTITVVGNDYINAITIAYPAPEVTHTFDAGVLADVAKESKADGETELVGDFFTIHYGKNSVVEGSGKTFADGFVSTKRFTLGGKATPGKDGKCCVEFTVSGKSTVKIWWISGGDGRQMTIFGADGTALLKTEVSVKNALYIAEFTVEAGTYFIGGDTGSNYIYQIVVSPYVAPAHECESICEECGLCLDAECLEDACADKCPGHAPVDLTPEAGEYLKYDGNDCYTFDRENYLEEITFTYENVSTNTYQNVNAWIKDKAAGKTTLDLYLVNNGTETVYVTVKLEAAGAVALAEEKVYVAAGEVKAVTLNFTGEAELLYFFIDTGWSETTTSHSGSVTVAGVRFSGDAGSVTPPADTGLQLNFWTSSSDYTTNGNNIKYSGAGNSYSCAGSADIVSHAAGKNTFTVTITNNGAAAAKVRIDIQGTTQVGNHTALNTGATGGDVWTDMDWGGSSVTVAAGESVTLVITYDENTDRGAVTNLVVFVDSARGDDATYNSDITLSGMAFSGESAPVVETVTYVLDATADLTAFAKGDKADGETQVLHDFFTLHYSASTKVDSSNKSWEDGYSATQRINFGGKMQVGSTTKQCIEFTVEAGATVTVWWVSGGEGRPMTIWNADKEVVAQDDNAENVSVVMSTFEITEAGKYYLGGSVNNNYIFKVEVTTTK